MAVVEGIRVKNSGLRGVVVADTKISFIDGEKGILIFRGYRVEDLVENSSFPETASLLLKGYLPDPEELQAFEEEIAARREIPGFIYDSFSRWPRGAHAMEVLQASVSMLGMADPDAQDESREANMRKAVRLIAGIPVIIAAWHRIRNGLQPLPSDPTLSHAGNFLWQLQGKKPDPEIARDLGCLPTGRQAGRSSASLKLISVVGALPRTLGTFLSG